MIDYSIITTPDGIEDSVLRYTGSDSILIKAEAFPLTQPATVSVWVKANTSTTITINALGTSKVFNVTTAWTRLRLTVVSPQNANIILRKTSSTAIVYLYKAQLELSERMSDWKPAPEDMYDEITRVGDNASSEIARVDSNLSDVNENIENANNFQSTFYHYFTLDPNDGIVMRASTETGEQSHWYAQMKSDGFYIYNDSYVTPTGRFYRDRFEPSSMQMGKMKCRPSARGGWIFTHER